MSRTKKILTVAFFLIGILVVARLCLPSVVKHVINKTLQNDIDGYTGSVSDVDIHLWRGAYAFDNLKLMKVAGKVPVPFIEVAKTDFSIEWKSVWDGSLVGEITASNPKINFVDGPTEAQTQTGEEGNWRETVHKLFPLRINTFTVNNGEIHFQNFHSSPKVDVFINKLQVIARNLTNSEKISKSLVSTIDAKGKIMETGNMKVFLKMNPLIEQPPFDFNTAIENVNLAKLNDFFKAYVDVDMEKGKFNMYSEFAGDNGKFKGYVKPLFTDVKVLNVKKDIKKGPFRFLKEAGVALIAAIFKNHKHDRQATIVPLSGNMNNPDIDVWQTIINAVKNAFIKAIDPGLDSSVDMGKLEKDKDALKEKEENKEKADHQKEKEKRKEERKEKREQRREERKKEKEKD
ncbi:MAG: DUF748 domain-containing protein [Bacteroidota bacterium]